MNLRRRVAAALAGILPLGVLGVGATDAAFVDAAPLAGATLSTFTVPSIEPSCTTSNGTLYRNATLSWPNAGAGSTYQLQIFLSGTVYETKNMGAATSWSVPNGYGGLLWLTNAFHARVIVTHPSGWVGKPSAAGVAFNATGFINDEWCP